VANTFKVEIYDQTYRIQGQEDEEAYIQELARYVDRRMREIGEATGTVDTLRVAVLTALNIADELHLLRQQSEGVRDRAERCLRLVERALEHSA